MTQIINSHSLTLTYTPPSFSITNKAPKAPTPPVNYSYHRTTNRLKLKDSDQSYSSNITVTNPTTLTDPSIPACTINPQKLTAGGDSTKTYNITQENSDGQCQIKIKLGNRNPFTITLTDGNFPTDLFSTDIKGSKPSFENWNQYAATDSGHTITVKSGTATTPINNLEFDSAELPFPLNFPSKTTSTDYPSLITLANAFLTSDFCTQAWAKYSNGTQSEYAQNPVSCLMIDVGMMKLTHTSDPNDYKTNKERKPRQLPRGLLASAFP